MWLTEGEPLSAEILGPERSPFFGLVSCQGELALEVVAGTGFCLGKEKPLNLVLNGTRSLVCLSVL